MPIPNDVTRVSILGTGPGAETFDVSFWLGSGASTGNAGAAALAASIRDLWVTNASGSWRSQLGGDQAYTEVRVYSYPNGGPSAGFIGSATFPASPGTGGTMQALQQAMVISLRTNWPGRRFRGRMYLPATGTPATTAHQFSAAALDSVANGTKAFFDAVNALADTGPVSVVSQVGAGDHTPVLELRVDSKPDIQRRRANKILATTTKIVTLA